MNFIALGVIAEIDNLYAARLFDFKCSKVLEEENLPLVHKGGIPGYVPSCWVKMQRMLYKLFKLFFVCFYYYFAAFLPIILSVNVPPKKDAPVNPYGL